MEFMKGILASVAAVVVCGFCPKPEWIAVRCIEGAVKRMPKQHQDRMREEWHAELVDQPGGFWTLCWSIDLLRAAKMIARELEQTVSQQVINLKPGRLSVDTNLDQLNCLLQKHNEGKINVEVTCHQLELKRAHISELIQYFETMRNKQDLTLRRTKGTITIRKFG